ncbi:MAG TPA: glycosyltransferase, partial [Ktedonosporobacter sp.]|nr:glycosyltransferase [Ktedonosporobacter sp.]
AGLPVLSMELEAIAEVLRTSQVGEVIDSLDPPQIAAGINRMLADPAALAQMSHNALRVAREQFNWEIEKRELVLFYQKMLSSI